ncbi:hypothetical protein [Anaplasma phagocytophilum]
MSWFLLKVKAKTSSIFLYAYDQLVDHGLKAGDCCLRSWRQD